MGDPFAENRKKMKRTRRTTSQMYPIIEDYLSSELSQLEYCETNNLAQHVLSYWLKQYREQNSSKIPHFAPVEISSTENHHVQISFPNGMEIKIPIH